MRYWLVPRDPPRLLTAILRAFEGPDAAVSLEGELAAYALWALEHTTAKPSAVLARQTESPILDFLIAPLSAHNGRMIARAVARPPGLGAESPIVHVQVAVGHTLVFGAYDNFHADAVFVAGPSEDALKELKRSGVIWSYHGATE